MKIRISLALLTYCFYWPLLSGILQAQDWDSRADSTWSLTVAAVGDMVLGTDYPELRVPPDSGRTLFNDVISYLQWADFAFGNQEGPLASGGHCTKEIGTGKSYAFRIPPYLAANLAQAGFDVLNLANNHINDFGPEALQESYGVLENLGIRHTGPIGDIAYFETRGKKVSVIGFSTSVGTHTIHDVPAAQMLVADLSRRCDLVIVSFHAGSEGVGALHTYNREEELFGEPRGNVIRFAHAVIDSGADLVLGHGPHVPRALELYRDRLIAYSLGNFVTFGGLSCKNECGQSLILQVRLDSTGKFAEGRVIPIQIEFPGFPKIDNTGRSLTLLRELDHADFPVSSPEIDPQGYLRPRTN